VSPVVSTLRACRIREGTHHVRITKTDVEVAYDWHDLSIRELLNESLRAQHAGDARRGWLLATAAAVRYRRALREARRAA
jgi:hypothetical protein